jgi:hypothetical protein
MYEVGFVHKKISTAPASKTFFKANVPTPLDLQCKINHIKP